MRKADHLWFGVHFSKSETIRMGASSLKRFRLRAAKRDPEVNGEVGACPEIEAIGE